MQLQVTEESELVLCLLSDVMPCSVVGESIIKNHHCNNLRILTSLRVFIEHFSGNTIHKHIKVFAEKDLNPLLSYEII